jgi:uncharacterized damage-inducible protein DinB
MNLEEHYRYLSSYDAWANLEVIAALRSAGQPLERARKLMAHIVSAELVWLTRIEKSWRGLLAGDVLDRSVHYKNSKGEAYESLVRDILTHVFMHSAYHRGQIASDMRQAGSAPAYTDFIHGVRQGLVE